MRLLQITKDNGPVQKELFFHEKNFDIENTVFTYTISARAMCNEEGSVVYRFPFEFKGPFILFPRIGVVFRHLVNMIDVSDIELVHAHFLSMDGYIAYKIKKKYGIPYVVTVRNTDLNLPGLWEFPWNKIVLKRTLREASGIIFLSKSYKKKLYDRLDPSYQEEIEKKSYIIPNGINNFYLDNRFGRKKLGNTVKVLSVGDIVRNKNHVAVAEAIMNVRDKGYDISYEVVGKKLDGHIVTTLEKSGVKVTNFCDKTELIKIYRDNDIFVMPSFRESFGLVYAEALSQGMPVVYSKGEGFDGQFEEGEVGYGVNPYSVDEITSVIIKLIGEYDRLSSNACFVAKSFAWDIVTEKNVNVYKKVISRKDRS